MLICLQCMIYHNQKCQYQVSLTDLLIMEQFNVVNLKLQFLINVSH